MQRACCSPSLLRVKLLCLQIGAKFACRRMRSDYHQATWDSMLAACLQKSGAEEAEARQLEMAAATKAIHFSIGQEVC